MIVSLMVWYPVHPRVRGERRVPCRMTSGFNGSSPRARGTPQPADDDGRDVRFIPACAGNAFSLHHFLHRPAVHPRVRGERPPRRAWNTFEAGSSPRARGTPFQAQYHAPVPRFIPACAGNAEAAPAAWPRRAVHPRVRGERQDQARCHRSSCGSSPRARGTRCWVAHRVLCSRFIPACAGNAHSPSDISRARWVHPRVRGERYQGVCADVASAGSSPRARGTPCRHLYRRPL